MTEDMLTKYNPLKLFKLINPTIILWILLGYFIGAGNITFKIPNIFPVIPVPVPKPEPVKPDPVKPDWLGGSELMKSFTLPPKWEWRKWPPNPKWEVYGREVDGEFLAKEWRNPSAN